MSDKSGPQEGVEGVVEGVNPDFSRNAHVAGC